MDDKRKPYKALVAALIAGLSVLVASQDNILPPWALLVVAVLLAGLATYQTPNPPA